MPRNITVTFSDGTSHVYNNAPDDATPEQVAERARADFGKDVSALDGGRKGTPGVPQAQAPAAPAAPKAPKVPTVENAKSVIESLIPNAYVTDWKRDPNSKLGLANPGSYHNNSGGAVDIRPIPGMTFEDVSRQIEDAGYTIIQSRDEVKNPSKHATGAHWHFVLGGGPPQTEEATEGYEIDPSTDVGPDLASTAAITGSRKPLAKPKGPGAVEAAILGFGDGVTFGFLDEAGAVADTLLGGNKKTIWDGSSFTDAYLTNRDANRKRLKTAEEDHFGSFLTGGLASALLPIGAAGGVLSGGKGLTRAAKAAETANEASRLQRYGKAAAAGAGAGGLYGVGSGEGDIRDHAESAALGAAIGAPLGMAGEKVMTTVGRAVSKDARNTRWANKEVGRNDFAAYDAEIVDDLTKLTKDRAVSGSDAKGRTDVTIDSVNALERSYTTHYKTLIDRLDIPTTKKDAYKAMLTDRKVMSAEDLDEIRGTVEGDAIADGIIKSQRLRHLTDRKLTNKGFMAGVVDKVGLAADLAPLMGLPGTYGVSTIGIKALRKMGAATGDVNTIRADEAQRLLNRSSAYRKLGELTGPSGARESKDALWQKVMETEMGKQADEAARALEKSSNPSRIDMQTFRNDITQHTPDERDLDMSMAASRLKSIRSAMKRMEGKQVDELTKFDTALNTPSEITSKDLSSFRNTIKDPELDPRDLNIPTPTTERQLAKKVQDRNKAMAAMENKAADWEAKLADPSTAPAPKASKARKSDPAQDAIDDAIAKGIKGDSGTQAAFASRLGITKDDMLKTLDHIEADVPDLASEIARIRSNYPTRDRKMGSVLAPRMRKAMDDLGIKPKANSSESLPIDDAAQARLAGKTSETVTKKEEQLLARLDEVDPVVVELDDGTATRASETEGFNVSDAERAEATAIREELEGLRRVDRPVQWEQGRNRYQAQAQDAIDRMRSSSGVSPDALGLLGNTPVQIRDNFKTTEDALRFINEKVLPDFQDAGFSSKEVDSIRSHLSDIAHAKPYYDQASYEAGTRRNKRGRPSKEQ